MNINTNAADEKYRVADPNYNYIIFTMRQVITINRFIGQGKLSHLEIARLLDVPEKMIDHVWNGNIKKVEE